MDSIRAPMVGDLPTEDDSAGEEFASSVEHNQVQEDTARIVFELQVDTINSATVDEEASSDQARLRTGHAGPLENQEREPKSKSPSKKKTRRTLRVLLRVLVLKLLVTHRGRQTKSLRDKRRVRRAKKGRTAARGVRRNFWHANMQLQNRMPELRRAFVPVLKQAYSSGADPHGARHRVSPSLTV